MISLVATAFASIVLHLHRHLSSPELSSTLNIRCATWQRRRHCMSDIPFERIALIHDATEANVRHATKLSNFSAQLCCATKLPRIEMVSIQQISCATRQKLGNLRSQTGNFIAQQSWARKLLNFVACLTLVKYSINNMWLLLIKIFQIVSVTKLVQNGYVILHDIKTIYSGLVKLKLQCPLGQ